MADVAQSIGFTLESFVGVVEPAIFPWAWACLEYGILRISRHRKNGLRGNTLQEPNSVIRWCGRGLNTSQPAFAHWSALLAPNYLLVHLGANKRENASNQNDLKRYLS